MLTLPTPPPPYPQPSLFPPRRACVHDTRDTSFVAGLFLQVLECEIVPLRSERLRVAIQSGGECRGKIFVDAVELFHGGPTPAERAISSIVSVLQGLWPTPSKV